MTAFARDNGAWVEGPLITRHVGAWIDPRSNGFIRDNGAWVQFQPPPSSSLLPPTNLTVVPTSIAATATWTNPTQTLTPTEVQFRVPEITTVWTELNYPATVSYWSALNPSTEYQYQIRYIIRSSINGLITATSDTVTRFFTTQAAYGPSNPAPDPGGSGPATWIPWSPTTNPATCSWEYVVQDPDTAESALVWRDTLVTGTFSGAGGNQSIDFIALGFACGAFLRLKFREVCDSIPGAWNYGEPFSVPCDWDAACSGLPVATWTEAAWADAAFGMPVVCQREGLQGLVMEDYITTDTYARLPGYVGYAFGDSKAWVMGRVDNSNAGTPTVGGTNTGLVGVSETTDFSVTMTVRLYDQPNNELAGGTLLAMIGNQIRIRAYSQGAGYVLAASWYKAGGGSFQITSTVEVALGAIQTLVLSIDQDGTKFLNVERTITSISDTDTPSWAGGAFNQDIVLHTNGRGRVRSVGGWKRAMTVDESNSFFLSDYDRAVVALEPDIIFRFTSATFGPQLPDPTYDEAVDLLNPDIEFRFNSINP
jgi:hypothetical protein